MNEHPILFSPPMVQANLNDRKTMTRRAIDPQPDHFHKFKGSDLIPQNGDKDLKCRYGQPGDLLWVKEAFFAYGHWTCVIDTDGKKSWSFQDLTISEGFQYKYVDCPPENVFKNRGHLGWYKRPSVFMPKIASRIWLQVEEIRVERIQDITEKDAMAEGVEYEWYDKDRNIKMEAAKLLFKKLWIWINGEESWKANPWVWVVKYKILSTTGKPNSIPQ